VFIPGQRIGSRLVPGLTRIEKAKEPGVGAGLLELCRDNLELLLARIPVDEPSALPIFIARSLGVVAVLDWLIAIAVFRRGAPVAISLAFHAVAITRLGIAVATILSRCRCRCNDGQRACERERGLCKHVFSFLNERDRTIREKETAQAAVMFRYSLARLRDANIRLLPALLRDGTKVDRMR